MNIFVLIVALVIVRAEDNDRAEDYDSAEDTFIDLYHSDNIKELVETAKLQIADVLRITRNIFSKMEINCGDTMRIPKENEIQSPTSACDLAVMADLKKGYENPSSFNSTEFLNSFWSSETGRGVMKEIKAKGVREEVIKAAMNDTWFQLGLYAESSFNRLFFAHKGSYSRDYLGRNSWYASDLDRDRPHCTVRNHGNVPPVIVFRRCEDEEGEYLESGLFIYPNHPFVDLALYTLCAWVETPRKIREDGFGDYKCDVIVPGSKSTFKIEITKFLGENFLGRVTPDG